MREGGFKDIGVHPLRILSREGGRVQRYWGPFIEDPMKRREGGGMVIKK